MNKSFTLIGCPKCLDADFDILLVNLLRPFGEKVQLINIFNDPRTQILADLYGTPDPYGWKVPVAFLDKPAVKKFFNTYEEGRDSQVMIAGILFPGHHADLFSSYFEE